jgi:hypothetical protein
MLTHTRLADSVLSMIADVPMAVYKRLAVYPIVSWFLLGLLLPNRLLATIGSSMFILFAMSALGVVGAIVRWGTRD